MDEKVRAAVDKAMADLGSAALVLPNDAGMTLRDLIAYGLVGVRVSVNTGIHPGPIDNTWADVILQQVVLWEEPKA